MMTPFENGNLGDNDENENGNNNDPEIEKEMEKEKENVNENENENEHERDHENDFNMAVRNLAILGNAIDLESNTVSITQIETIEYLKSAGITQEDIHCRVRSRSPSLSFDSDRDLGVTPRPTTEAVTLATPTTTGTTIETATPNTNVDNSFGTSMNIDLSAIRSKQLPQSADFRREYLKKQVSVNTLQANHGRMLMKHVEKSNKIVVSAVPIYDNENGIDHDGKFIIGKVSQERVINTLTLCDEDHAILTLLQSFLIEQNYLLPHWCEYVAWIVGSIWILICASVLVIYGINFDLESNAAAVDTISKDIKMLNESNCTYQFVDYAISYTNQINYQLSTEYALNQSKILHETNRRDNLWSESDISDARSWFFSFLLSFLVSIVLWSPLSTIMFAFVKFWVYKLVWKDYYKSNYYYMQCKKMIVNDSMLHGRSRYEIEYYDSDSLNKYLKEKVHDENDLWRLIATEIGIKALCQYPLWVLQHPHINQLRQYLAEQEQNV